jgi:hypothetical protein
LLVESLRVSKNGAYDAFTEKIEELHHHFQRLLAPSKLK